MHTGCCFGVDLIVNKFSHILGFETMEFKISQKADKKARIRRNKKMINENPNHIFLFLIHESGDAMNIKFLAKKAGINYTTINS